MSSVPLRVEDNNNLTALPDEERIAWIQADCWINYDLAQKALKFSMIFSPTRRVIVCPACSFMERPAWARPRSFASLRESIPLYRCGHGGNTNARGGIANAILAG